MPETGPGSIARPARRLGALLVDWLACTAIAVGLFQSTSVLTLGIFALENLVLLTTLGTTLGHRLFGLRVTGLGGGPVTPLAALIRTALLCLFIPAVVSDDDFRGLHDRLAGTVIVRA
ncbi:RDD family protein [Bailinhaonella thermotolerans]|nr:RDD family protein [Bailinhaonella thermotolerans]